MLEQIQVIRHDTVSRLVWLQSRGKTITENQKVKSFVGMLLKNQIFYFFLQKSARSNVYKLFLRQYFLCKSTILSKFVAPSSSNFTTSNEHFELNNQRKRLS